MFCSACGAQNADDARFCQKCGHAVNPIAAPAPQPSPATAAAPVNPGYVPQPMSAGAPAPSSNLVWAVLATIFCCLPFGIVGIVYGAKVGNLVAMGRYDEARDASRKAAMWSWIAAGLGFIGIILSLILGVMSAIVGAAAQGG